MMSTLPPSVRRHMLKSTHSDGDCIGFDSINSNGCSARKIYYAPRDGRQSGGGWDCRARALRNRAKSTTGFKQSPFAIVILSSERRFYRRAKAHVNNEKHKPLLMFLAISPPHDQSFAIFPFGRLWFDGFLRSFKAYSGWPPGPRVFAISGFGKVLYWVCAFCF
jgi:hypothetical protein